jgi:putative aldouronate transport system permease protein
MSTRPAWLEKPTRTGVVAKAVVLTAIVAAVLLPFYVVTLTSLSDRRTVTESGGLVMVPGGISVDAYQEILSGGVVTRALLVSMGITLVGTALSTTLSVLAAYGLSRPGSLGHRPLLVLVLITFLFGPGIIPSYLMVRSLGLIDTYAALILPGAVAAFHVVVLRSFFMQLPHELLDSARIDGAGEFRILSRIVMPLSKGVIAVIALFYAVGYWNAFFTALLYLNDNAKWPLQLVLRTYVLQGSPLPITGGEAERAAAANAVAEAPPPALSIQMAVVVLAILPIVFIYPLVQRHFVKGVIIGAVKG